MTFEQLIKHFGTQSAAAKAIEQAGRVAQRQERISAAPAPGISPEDAARWLAQYGNDMSYFMQKGLFDGSEQAGKLAREYVETVNPECL